MSTPKKNVVYVFYIGLVDAGAAGKFKAAPTLATGDFKFSKNGAAFDNLATLPAVSPSGGIAIKVSLSAAEMDDNKVVVTGIDAAGAEWSDVLIFIDAPDVNVADLVRSTTPANKLDVELGGTVGVDWGNVANQGTTVNLSATTTNLVNTTTTNTDLVTAAVIADAVWDELQSAHVTVGSFGEIATEMASVLDDTGTSGVVLAVGSIDSTAIATSGANEIRDAILSDSTPFLGASIASILTQVNKIPEGIKKNTALNDVGFVMYDVTDHVSPISDRTVAGSRSIDGGAFVAVTGAFAQVANGAYVFDAAAADTNGDFIMWRFTATGADDVFIPFKTTP